MPPSSDPHDARAEPVAPEGPLEPPAAGAPDPAALAAEPVVEAAPLTADTRAVVLRDVVKVHAAPAGTSVGVGGISLDIAGRGLHAISGPAGAGVTTLLGLIACLDRPDAGQIWVAGVDVVAATRGARRELRRRVIGIVGADPTANLLGALTAGANLTWAARRRTGAVLNASGVEAHLEMVGLGGRARARVRELTLGDRQRLAFAAAMVGSPRLVVADDPTATLDRAEATRFVNAVRDAADRGICVVVGTRDPILAQVADTRTDLVAGRILG